MPESSILRRLPVGAEVQPGGGVHFRVWAPDWEQLELVLEDRDTAGRTECLPMTREPDGYFALHVPQAGAGTRYRFRLGGESLYPDPASRWQPEGPHGPSEVVDPGAYAWQDGGWNGVTLAGQVIYELHIGTFTPEGTFASAARELAELAALGITLVEVMPVAEYPGKFGWGYDGVDLYAPEQAYGSPDDFRRFVDEAHRVGLGVMLDVVYNHFGPDGNYTGKFARAYQSHHGTEWGESLNFDGDNSGPVREFFIANAGYWIDEFHIDGLRLDAVHAIHDESSEHILAAISRRAREAATGRTVLVIAENESQQARLMRSPDQGGYGLDAAWNDDFHHAAQVAATGRKEYYYADFQGTPQELISAVCWGYLYQGQWSPHQQRPRGTPALDLPAARFVTFLQNHDQVSNSARGLRLHAITSPGRYRALTALLLLSPGTPLLFQGQEFAASSPFLYFADHEQALAKLVADGRWQFLRRFEGLAGPESETCPPELCGPGAFERSKLDLSERERHGEAYALHRDLLRLRREDPVFASQRADRIHGAVIGPEAFLLRYFGEEGDDRLLLVNLGPDLAWAPIAEPLAASPQSTDWTVLWSSEDFRYGGGGMGVLETCQWRVAGHAAVVLRAIAPDRA
jgi:maltooligosyltrehalose trehalohydrolase